MNKDQLAVTITACTTLVHPKFLALSTTLITEGSLVLKPEHLNPFLTSLANRGIVVSTITPVYQVKGDDVSLRHYLIEM